MSCFSFSILFDEDSCGSQAIKQTAEPTDSDEHGLWVESQLCHFPAGQPWRRGSPSLDLSFLPIKLVEFTHVKSSQQSWAHSEHAD